MCRNQNKQFVFSHHTMLPYFRSMEAFFDLSLPKSWADLSDPQLLFFFRQHPLRMGFPRQLQPLPSPLPTHIRHRVLHPPHRGISDTKHHRHAKLHRTSPSNVFREWKTSDTATLFESHGYKKKSKWVFRLKYSSENIRKTTKIRYVSVTKMLLYIPT